MSDKKNKVKFGLKNLHYAKATIADDGSATYETPVKFPGAVSISLDPQGENTVFYADNGVYYSGAGNNGYEGDLEVARVPESFEEDIMKALKDGKGVIVEAADIESEHFALLWEFAGDVKATRHVLYNCTAGRTSVASSTTTETKEPVTDTLSISAGTIYNAALDQDIVKVKTGPETDDTTYDNWYKSVYQPTAATTTP